VQRQYVSVTTRHVREKKQHITSNNRKNQSECPEEEECGARRAVGSKPRPRMKVAGTVKARTQQAAGQFATAGVVAKPRYNA